MAGSRTYTQTKGKAPWIQSSIKRPVDSAQKPKVKKVVVESNDNKAPVEEPQEPKAIKKQVILANTLRKLARTRNNK